MKSFCPSQLEHRELSSSIIESVTVFETHSLRYQFYFLPLIVAFFFVFFTLFLCYSNSLRPQPELGMYHAGYLVFAHVYIQVNTVGKAPFCKINTQCRRDKMATNAQGKINVTQKLCHRWELISGCG